MLINVGYLYFRHTIIALCIAFFLFSFIYLGVIAKFVVTPPPLPRPGASCGDVFCCCFFLLSCETLLQC